MIVNSELANSTGHLKKDLWETPKYIFDELNKEFNFTLDPCCTKDTAKCDRFFTPDDDGLKMSWRDYVCFVNPPYSRGNIDLWVEKCFREAHDNDTLVVGLLPVSTSSKWFHRWVKNAVEIRFIKGRIKFVGAIHTAPFSSMIVVF